MTGSPTVSCNKQDQYKIRKLHSEHMHKVIPLHFGWWCCLLITFANSLDPVEQICLKVIHKAQNNVKDSKGLNHGHVQMYQRGTCIKGLKWPPLEQKSKICFSQISLDLFIRRMAEV